MSNSCLCIIAKNVANLQKNIETASIIQIFELSLHSKSIKINNQMDDYPANSSKLLG